MQIALIAAYLAVLALVICGWTYWFFAAYLVGEVGKMAFGTSQIILDVPVAMGVVLRMRQSDHYYMMGESAVMALKLLAGAEAWLWLTYYMNREERRNVALAGLGAGLVLVAVALRVWEPDLWIRVFNQARLSVHLLAGGFLGSAVLWLTLFPVRMPSGARWHAWVWVGYLGMFIRAGLTVAESEAEWDAARLSFRWGILACLLLWTGYQGYEFVHLRLKRRDSALL